MTRKTIQQPIQVQQEIDKSKFLTYLFPVHSEEEAKLYLQQVKKEHPKATHHCTALIVGDIVRSNDDGEPGSSAGMPMLQTLQGNNMDQIFAVVVRYFGGTLLGVGGLIRAYSSSVTQAIKTATLLKPQNVYQYHVSFPYDKINEIETFALEHGTIIDRIYESNVTYIIDIINPEVMETIADITTGLGHYTLEKTYEVWLEVKENDS